MGHNMQNVQHYPSGLEGSFVSFYILENFSSPERSERKSTVDAFTKETCVCLSSLHHYYHVSHVLYVCTSNLQNISDRHINIFSFTLLL